MENIDKFDRLTQSRNHAFAFFGMCAGIYFFVQCKDVEDIFHRQIFGAHAVGQTQRLDQAVGWNIDQFAHIEQGFAHFRAHFATHKLDLGGI